MTEIEMWLCAATTVIYMLIAAIATPAGARPRLRNPLKRREARDVGTRTGQG